MSWGRGSQGWNTWKGPEMALKILNLAGTEGSSVVFGETEWKGGLVGGWGGV